VNGVRPDLATTLFTLPPDAKVLPVGELSARLRARIGPIDGGQAVITRPGFRVTTRLVPGPLAELLEAFREPSLLTDGVLRFARAHDEDPLEMLDLAFDALATLVESRILVPQGSPDAAAPTPSLAAGQAFAGFEIDVLVRSLEDSEVYRAHAPDRQLVAVKVGRDDRPGVAAMLAHEARMLARLEGADAPALLAEGTDHGHPYVAMTWCDGVSIAVAAQQARAARDRRRLQHLVGRMLDAYGRLHRIGVLHGDVHPGNCFVRDDGTVVLLDFGTARLIDASLEEDPARAGIAQFHDPQMAEALLAGRVPPAATEASEQYAICVLAYLLMTGLQPIEAPAVQDELFRRIVRRPPLPFAARGVASWPEVEAVLARGLAKSPAERFTDVSTLAVAFKDASIPAVEDGVPAQAQRAFEAEIERLKDLVVSTDPLDDAWFALRAALALEDPELLAAADVFARRAEASWAAGAVAALVAHARSDARMQDHAIAAFRASVEQLPDGADAASAILAAASLLAGSVSSAANVSLAAWTTQRLERLMGASVTPPGDGGVDDATLAYVALMVAKAGVMAVPPDLEARLDVVRTSGAGDVWLWALAHDVYADDSYRQRALDAVRPEPPAQRALALLRCYQLTGDETWIAAAREVVTEAMAGPAGVRGTALIVCELMQPEQAVLPPYAFPLRTVASSL
jgi:hypothetical protein